LGGGGGNLSFPAHCPRKKVAFNLNRIRPGFIKSTTEEEGGFTSMGEGKVSFFATLGKGGSPRHRLGSIGYASRRRRGSLRDERKANCDLGGEEEKSA